MLSISAEQIIGVVKSVPAPLLTPTVDASPSVTSADSSPIVCGKKRSRNRKRGNSSGSEDSSSSPTALSSGSTPSLVKVEDRGSDRSPTSEAAFLARMAQRAEEDLEAEMEADLAKVIPAGSKLEKNRSPLKPR